MAANDLFKVGNPLLPCSALKLSQDVNPSLYSFLFFLLKFYFWYSSAGFRDLCIPYIITLTISVFFKIILEQK
jgi:hypothetical protein